MTTHFNYPTPAVQEELRKIAAAIVAPGKGILAADESTGTIGQRFVKIGAENNEENRRLYRQLLFTADKALADNISGVILFHETLYHKDDNGTPFPKLLQDLGIIPGIKVDTGTVKLFGTEDEVTTQGSSTLNFLMWKNARSGSWDRPMTTGIHISLIRAGLLDICGTPSWAYHIILPDGDHDLEQAQKVAETVLAAVYKALNDHHVFLEGTLLKPSMVTAGQSCPKKYTPQEIAAATVTAFSRTVPAAVTGITFLSGGQSEEEATVNLDAINKFNGKKPWPLSFSFGRALQASVLKAWGGKPQNIKAAQNELLKRAKANGLAALGKYEQGSITGKAAGEGLFVKNHAY
uniref:Fructose-bisphosphate aldolase n=1 Tax=Timema bartmani TaxID=61472 RepID=A0A7R9HZS1_9NEOP|nr:unnamed protein product [Timema bartmani]